MNTSERIKDEKDYNLTRNIAAKVGEHFQDFVLITRTRDGLNWRMSDRTFAVGACQRLIMRMNKEDAMHAEDIRESRRYIGENDAE